MVSKKHHHIFLSPFSGRSQGYAKKLPSEKNHLICFTSFKKKKNTPPPGVYLAHALSVGGIDRGCCTNVETPRIFFLPQRKKMSRAL